jgi:hypothetical protein
MGGLGLFELLILILIAGTLAVLTVGNRRVRDYGRNLGRGRRWDSPHQVLEELESLRIRVDALAQRLDSVSERLDAAHIPGTSEIPPGQEP